MSKDELEILIKLFTNISDNAYALVILVFIKYYIQILLGYGLGFFVAYKILGIVTKMVKSFAFKSKLDSITGHLSSEDYSQEKFIDLIKKLEVKYDYDNSVYTMKGKKA